MRLREGIRNLSSSGSVRGSAMPLPVPRHSLTAYATFDQLVDWEIALSPEEKLSAPNLHLSLKNGCFFSKQRREV